MSEKRFRSSSWFSKLDKDGFIHRSWVGRGLPPDVFDGRPIVGICNTWSELTPCNGTFRELAEHVKRGVWEAGGLPFEFPVMSTGWARVFAHVELNDDDPQAAVAETSAISARLRSGGMI